VGKPYKTAGRRWREYRNALQCGKGVYVSIKIEYIIACVLEIFIDYLTSIVCIAVEWEKAFFCYDFCFFSSTGKERRKNI